MSSSEMRSQVTHTGELRNVLYFAQKKEKENLKSSHFGHKSHKKHLLINLEERALFVKVSD